MSDFDKLKTEEERREWIEARHEEIHGKSHFWEQARAIEDALGGRYDKSLVLKVMAEVLGVEPVEKDGVYLVGDWEVSFDKDNILNDMSASSGSSGIIQADVKNSGDT